MALEREMETYRRELPGLLGSGQEGKWALVHGDKLDSVHETQAQAMQTGYDRFGLEIFLVKQIVAVEKPLYFSRNIVPCPSSPKT